MRLRLTVLASAVAACACAAIPAIAGAAPRHHRALTIHATPHSIIAGESVLIYGRLEGRASGNQIIHLYHRIPNRRFSLISTTRTDASGRYEFPRAEGIVDTNRSWFVRGPVFTHSRTIHEQVAAEVSLMPSANAGTTRHPIVFSGHLTPDHAGAVVALQAQRGSSDDWTTLRTARVARNSNYQISYAWRTAGGHDVRVRLAGDRRNDAAVSDPAAVVIEEAQAAGFTIHTSDAVVSNRATATISGTLDQPNGSAGESNTSVSLYGHQPGTPASAARLAQTTTTQADGDYSFTVQNSTNELYQVRTTYAPRRASAILFEGVQDVVDMTVSASTSTVNGRVRFTGTVSPGKAGHVVYLQKLGRDNNWHAMRVTTATNASTFSFGWTFGTPGTKQFRAGITGGPANVGGASATVPIVVSLPALSSLPTS